MKYDVSFKSFISKHVIVTKYILSNIVKGIYLWQVKKNCSKKILKLYSKDTSWKKDILFLDCLRYVIVVLIFFFWNDYSWQSSITHFLLLTPVQAQRKRQREFLDEHSIKTRTFKFLETFPRVYAFHSNDFLEVAVWTNNRFRNMFTWCLYQLVYRYVTNENWLA